LNEAGVPAYTFPESAARALAAMVRHRRWLERPVTEPVRFDVDARVVERILAGARSDGRTTLKEHEALDVLAAYGVPVVPHRLVTTHTEAREAAGEIGYPVVLKAVAPGLVHKSDVGAVRVDLRTPAELDTAFGEMIRSLGESSLDIEGILVQPFASGGRETIVGMSTDPLFGPILMFGLGGIHVEALKDVAFRLAPVTGIDACEMLSSIRGARLLDELRGEPAADRAALVEAIQRISQLVEEHTGIAELDVNPLLAFPEGCLAVDGRIRLHPEG
ncbi:MAG TPA: acetate--CoA ligase family protein, partial [Longimicrobiales bacterium]|nr:acetate--CoA ligase family protein [Longimicrobiales bacterium]